MATSPQRPEELEELEVRLGRLRPALRQAVRAGDTGRAGRLRRALQETESTWEGQLAAEQTAAAPPPLHPAPAPVRAARAVPVREQVRQTLAVLGAPASPKLISTAREALFAEPLPAARLASLRRDERASFLKNGDARPYYICAALTETGFHPARGLLALSTWPLQHRITGPDSPRADHLTHTTGVAEHLAHLQHAHAHTTDDPGPHDTQWPGTRWLLRRLALTLPGALTGNALSPHRVLTAAHAEAETVHPADSALRKAAADRARQLDPVEQLFGHNT